MALIETLFYLGVSLQVITNKYPYFGQFYPFLSLKLIIFDTRRKL